MLSAVNSDAAIALELPQTVMVSVNAAVIKVTTFFFFMICFPLVLQKIQIFSAVNLNCLQKTISNKNIA